MANGMPTWSEWNNLTEDQRRYQKYKILNDLYEKVDSQHNECFERVPKCEKRISAIETRDNRIKWMASGFGIAGAGGMLGAAEIWQAIKRLFS